VGINHDRRALSGFPGSVVNFKSRERNGAFGLEAATSTSGHGCSVSFGFQQIINEIREHI
jgi:hypothetical protein